MKRFFAWMLTLAMLASLVPAALAEPAVEAQTGAAALPGVGDVVCGFEVTQLRDYPLMNAVIVCFEHRKTGAKLYYFANDDTNRIFDLTFFTDAVDNTGLPHVFEHVTTAGSEKYPSAALWFNLEFQTYNTFWNATTYKDMTSYPCASLSEAQLLKYADYFTDSCFNPTLMYSDETFRTEGWRYRLDDADAPLTIEGTVYSEMLGAWTLTRVAELNALRAAFPGSIVGNDSGGDPDAIPDLTWETVKAYHDSYYHPSNCAAYLYGQFEDYAAFLELLDGYFSVYDRREFTHDDPGYTPITAPVVQSLPFPTEAGSDTVHASTVFYSFVCPGLKGDPAQDVLMNTLTDLLTDGASDLQQSLHDALPYGTFGCYIERQGPEDAVVFTAMNVDPEDAEVFKATVDAALRDVAENGFPQEQVDGVMNLLKISALLTREEGDPVWGLILPTAWNYAQNGHPLDYQDYQDALFCMDDWNRQGLYAKAVSDWLVDSQTTALVTTYPEPGGKEAKEAALAEKLAEIKAGMSEAEIAQIVAASNAAPEAEDTSELVARLQAVTVESLPEEWKRYDVTDETDDQGVRHIDAVAGMEGIGCVNLFLDAAGLAQEDIHWFSLYTDLVFKLDTAAHTKAELAKRVSRYFYGGGIGFSILREGEHGWHPYLSLSWIGQDDDLDEGYDLMREIAFDTKVDDPEKLMEQVQALKSGMKSSISSDPAGVLLRRALAVTDESLRYKTYAMDLDYYDFLVQTEQQLADDPDGVVAKLKGIQEYFNNRTNAIAMFSGNAASIALNRELSDAFLASLDAREIGGVQYDLPVPERHEALVIESGAQYNLLVADYDTLGLEGYTGDMVAATNVIDDTFLYPLLRDQYGVYTPMTRMTEYEGLYVYAYRDPNIAETFRVLEALPEMVADMTIDQETLDGYILSAYTGFAKPLGELSGALKAASSVLQGLPQDMALTRMRQLKTLTPESLKGYADVYARLSENGLRRTAGGAAAIEANADLFDAIYNPFGAVDNTQVALTDAPEDSEHYRAVRFAFEQGFMAPLEADVFGVDAPATQGDLLAALNVLIGGERDADAALSAFVAYGLAAADTDLSAPIAPADVREMMSGLAGAQIEPLCETAAPDAVTRGELAEALMAFAGDAEE